MKNTRATTFVWDYAKILQDPTDVAVHLATDWVVITDHVRTSMSAKLNMFVLAAMKSVQIPEEVIGALESIVPTIICWIQRRESNS